MIIAFSGIDGSGKTTVASALAEELGAENRPVRYTWCRHESPRVFGIVRLMKKIAGDKNGNSAGSRQYLATKSRLLGSRLIGSLYRSFVLVDYVMEIHNRVSRNASDEEILIVDRFVLDVVADVIVECGLGERQSRRFLSALSSLTPIPSFTCIFKVPQSVSMERKDDILNEEYIDRRLLAYDLLTATVPAFVVDGTAPISESTRRIRELAGIGRNPTNSV